MRYHQHTQHQQLGPQHFSVQWIASAFTRELISEIFQSGVFTKATAGMGNMKTS